MKEWIEMGKDTVCQIDDGGPLTGQLLP